MTVGDRQLKGLLLERPGAAGGGGFSEQPQYGGGEPDPRGWVGTGWTVTPDSGDRTDASGGINSGGGADGDAESEKIQPNAGRGCAQIG